MAVGNCGDDILWAKSRIATKKYRRICRLKGNFVNHRHIPFTELKTHIPLNPGEGVLLANRNQHIVTGHYHRIFASGYQAAFTVAIVNRFHSVKPHGH